MVYIHDLNLNVNTNTNFTGDRKIGIVAECMDPSPMLQNLIEAYKIMRGIGRVDCHNFFSGSFKMTGGGVGNPWSLLGCTIWNVQQMLLVFKREVTFWSLRPHLEGN